MDDTPGRAQADVILDAIVRSVNQAVLAIDHECTITGWNPAAEALLGYRADEMLGRNIACILPPDQLNLYRSQLAEMLRGREMPRRDIEYLDRAGCRVAVQENLLPIRDAQGRVTGSCSLLQQVAQRLDDSIRETHDSLLQIAHDINNSLFAISGFTALALMGTMDTDTRASLQEIDRATQRAAELVQRLDALVRSDEATAETRPTPGGPLAAAASMPVTAAKAAIAATESRRGGVPVQRVLYVDDDEALVVLMSRQLKRLGYDVTGEVDARLALQRFQQDPMAFDVVVSDLSMPVLPGLDLAGELLRVRPGMPVVIISGHIGPEDQERAMKLGLWALIVKTATVEELGRELQQLFAAGPQSLS